MAIDPVWTQDPTILWRHPLEFWPQASMDAPQRANAVARWLGYTAVLLALTRHWLWVAVIGLFLFWWWLDWPEFRAMQQAVYTRLEPWWPWDNVTTGPTCTPPTPGNPYANPTAYDWERTTLPACQGTQVDLQVKSLTARYRDDRDLYDRNTLERHYTLPQTAFPADHSDFLQFMYPLKATCKEQGQCLLK